MNTLMIHRCPRCRYDLRGVELQASDDSHRTFACPECGLQCHGDMVLLDGRPLRRQPFVFAAFGMLNIFNGLFPTPYNIYFVLVLSCGLLCTFAFLAIRRHAKGFDSQLLIGPEGFARHRGEGEPVYTQWHKVKTWKVRRHFRWGLSRSKPLPPCWLVAFSGNSGIEPHDPKTWQKGGGMTYCAFVFEGDEQRANAVRSRIRQLFETGQSKAPPTSPNHLSV